MDSYSGIDFGAPHRATFGQPAVAQVSDGDDRPDGLTSALIQAEAIFAGAGERLRALMRGALAGTAYDPDALDAAILTYRGAEARAVDARVAWLRWQAGRVAPAA